LKLAVEIKYLDPLATRSALRGLYRRERKSVEMHQVRYFLAAARTLNFTRAAEESNVTQPSLTRAIQKLEEEFGGQLFRRERSLTHLTELGRMMVPHLERTYEAAQAAKMLAKGIGKAESAPMTLGVAGDLSVNMREALAVVAEALPGFQLSLVNAATDGLIDDLIKGELDAAFIVAPREMPDRLDRIDLREDAYVAIAHKTSALAALASPSIADLEDVPWVESVCDVAAEFRSQCAIAGINPGFRHTGQSFESVRDLVAANMGSAIVPSSMELPDSVTEVKIDGLQILRKTAFVTVSGRKRSTATDALIRAVRARNWQAD
jgi:DNA-binding transcriptional LysR family regulator